jgi:Flp pilus assembly protein TadD
MSVAGPIARDPQIAEWLGAAHRAFERCAYRDAHMHSMRVLERDPTTAEAYFVLALIAGAHDQFAKALDVIERALRFDPGNAIYHAHRGRFLIGLRRFADALQAAEQGMRVGPPDALTWDTLGVVLTRAGAHEKAVEPYRCAVALDPSKTNYWYNLGAALQFVGDFTEAEQAYRRVLELEPDHARAWSALAQVAKLTDADAAALEDLLRGTLSVDAELHLCHALAKHLETRGDYTRSFALLERGKRRKRAEIGYSIESDRELFEAARKTNVGPLDGFESSEPIFIVGMPRTGTTLVERIVSSHRDVFAAGELSHFSIAVKQVCGTPSPQVLDAETLAACARADVRGIGELYVSATRPRTGHTRHFIDKMPLNFFYAGVIRRALPNAKIICVRRNAMDTCLSNFRQLFATSFRYYHYSYDILDTGRYFLEFDALARYWRETLDANYMEIAYEDIVADTEREARRLLAFCGLDFDPACVQFHRNEAPVATASSVQVRQPIYKDAVERWRRYERELTPLRELLERGHSS